MLHTNFQGHQLFWFQRRRFFKVLSYIGMAAILVMWHKPFVYSLSFPITWRLHMKLGFISLAVSKIKKLENVESGWPWTEVNEWPWPLIFTASSNFDNIDYNSFRNIHYFIFLPYKSLGDQTWSCHKIGQCQSRVIIWTVLEPPMIHTNCQGHRFFGSREEDFLRFLPCMGMAAILVMWPGPFEQTLVPPSYEGSTWYLASIGLAVSKEMKFANVDLNDLGPRSMNDLDLYSYKFIYSFS